MRITVSTSLVSSRKTVGLCLFLAALTSASASTPPQVPEIDVVETASKILLTPPAGHHFNLKSPNRMTIDGKDTKGRIRERQISVTLPKGASEFQATAFVCDQALSYCARKTVRRKLGQNP